MGDAQFFAAPKPCWACRGAGRSHQLGALSDRPLSSSAGGGTRCAWGGAAGAAGACRPPCRRAARGWRSATWLVAAGSRAGGLPRHRRSAASRRRRAGLPRPASLPRALRRTAEQQAAGRPGQAGAWCRWRQAACRGLWRLAARAATAAARRQAAKAQLCASPQQQPLELDAEGPAGVASTPAAEVLRLRGVCADPSGQCPKPLSVCVQSEAWQDGAASHLPPAAQLCLQEQQAADREDAWCVP